MAEIRIAVCGYVSSGKTTTVNAIFGEEYGEVSMQCTTSCVNVYRIVPSGKSTVEIRSEIAPKNTSASTAVVLDSDEESKDFSNPDKVICKAKTVLQQSIADNKTFRDSDSVAEKTHCIQLRENLHTMSDNIALNIVDVPGINEAGTSSKYRDYVNKKWHSFDAVVFVMDGRQGANTDEQHQLLDLAKTNLKKKNIPVVFACNKIDDPGDQEQAVLLDQFCGAVEKMFGVLNRKADLDQLRRKSKNGEKFDARHFPAVVPMSALKAFLYQSVARLSKAEFFKLDMEYIEKIGKDSCGLITWRGLQDTEKMKEAWETVQDSVKCEAALKQSNFESFMDVLVYCIGDEKRQAHIVRKQAEVAVERITDLAPDCDLVAEFVKAVHSLKAVEEDAGHLSGKVLLAYSKVSNDALLKFADSFDPADVAPATNLLLDYTSAVQKLGWDHEIPKVVKQVKSLVNRYVLAVIESDHLKAKSKRDRDMICFSLTQCFNFEVFCLHFGPLKFHVLNYFDALKGRFKDDQFKSDSNGKSKACPRCSHLEVKPHKSERMRKRAKLQPTDTESAKKRTFEGTKIMSCTVCNGQFNVAETRLDGTSCVNATPSFPMKTEDGILVPKDPISYAAEGSFEIPDSIEDVKHFGCVVWRCCRFLNEQQTFKMG